MGGGMFIARGDDLIEMNEQAYDSEDLLQVLLAAHPNLMAGDQIDGTNPRRWLLIGREMPLASEDDGTGRWSVDHLFLDQDARPTLVEVKRSNNTEIRRRVVGQMLDYAANAVLYWPVATLRLRFEESCRARGDDHEAVFVEALASELDYEAFWERVAENLEARHLRLLFVSDQIPQELRRIVEFLNEEMPNLEVLAVEVRKFVGGGEAAFVPRVIGQTAHAEQRKEGKRRGRQWDEGSFFARLAEQCNSNDESVARSLLEWSRISPRVLTWGRGAQHATFGCHWAGNGRREKLFDCYSDGSVWVDLRCLGEERWRELVARYNAVTGVTIESEKYGAYRRIAMSDISAPPSVSEFLAAVEWICQQLNEEAGDSSAA